MSLTIDIEVRERKNSPLDLDYMAQRYKTENGLFTFTSPSLWTLEKHLFYLLKNSVEVSLLPKYIQKPWLLSYDQYGTVILEYVIMYVNNVFSADEFDIPTVVLPTMRAISEMCSDNFPKVSDTNLLEKIEW